MAQGHFQVGLDVSRQGDSTQSLQSLLQASATLHRKFFLILFSGHCSSSWHRAPLKSLAPSGPSQPLTGHNSQAFIDRANTPSIFQSLQNPCNIVSSGSIPRCIPAAPTTLLCTWSCAFSCLSLAALFSALAARFCKRTETIETTGC